MFFIKFKFYYMQLLKQLLKHQTKSEVARDNLKSQHKVRLGMAALTRLKTFCCLENRFRLGQIFKSGFHSTCKPSSLLRSNTTVTISRRSFFFEIFQKPSQRVLKIKDDVPDAFELIYRNTMSKYMLGAQLVCIVTGGLVFFALLFKSDAQINQQHFETWSPSARRTENEELYYVLFFTVFLMVMQVMITKTPVRIYKVPQTSKYIAVNYGHYFFGKEKYPFKRGDIVHMEETGILPWKDKQYVIESETDKRVIILLDYYFRRPADLNIMLGEQRDPDVEQ